MNIIETRTFAFLQQGMKDRHAYAIVLLASLDDGAFAALEQFAKDELAAQVAQDTLAQEVASLEALRPHWAQGYTSDSVAAQASTAALSQLWDMLKVESQTDAVIRLRAVTEAWRNSEALVKRVAGLNPDAGEIGAGMLASLVEEAQRIVDGRHDKADSMAYAMQSYEPKSAVDEILKK